MTSISGNVLQLFIPTYLLYPILSPLHHRPVVQNVHLVQQISLHPPSTIHPIRSYTRYTHASVIFIVLYPSCICIIPHALAVVLWYPRRGVVCTLADITHSLFIQKFPSRRYTRKPPHLYDMHYGPLAYCPGWCEHSSLGLLSTDLTCITWQDFQKPLIVLPLTYGSLSSGAFLDSVHGRMQPCLHAHIHVVSPLHILLLLFLPLTLTS